MTQKEEAQKELIEKLYSELSRRMNGPNGELLEGGNKDFCEGLLTAYRIVQTHDPDPSPALAENMESIKENLRNRNQDEFQKE